MMSSSQKSTPPHLEPLSEQSIEILELIANGFSNHDIIAFRPSYTFDDIRVAAQEAVELSQRIAEISPSAKKKQSQKFVVRPADERILQIRKKYPRAYLPWSDQEEQHLIALFQAGMSVKEMTAKFKRQPGAIRSRLKKLGLEI